LKLVLDTNTYCDFAEGRPDVVDAIATYGQFVFIPSVVLGELLFGFMKGNKVQANEKRLRQIVDRLKVEIVDINVDVARKCAMIQLSLQKRREKDPYQ
jgi:tRNA(fMet)-specific endonuclease VapC